LPNCAAHCLLSWSVMLSLGWTSPCTLNSMWTSNARILKAHSHSRSMSGSSIWASLECYCCFWIAVVPYYVTTHPSAI
jgi:hypothetical protein